MLTRRGFAMFQGSRLAENARYESRPGARRTVAVAIRGTLLFGFLDGKQVLVMCNPHIPVLCAGATQVYCQNHMARFAAERQYRAWAKAGRPA